MEEFILTNFWILLLLFILCISKNYNVVLLLILSIIVIGKIHWTVAVMAVIIVFVDSGNNTEKIKDNLTSNMGLDELRPPSKKPDNSRKDPDYE